MRSNNQDLAPETFLRKPPEARTAPGGSETAPALAIAFPNAAFGALGLPSSTPQVDQSTEPPCTDPYAWWCLGDVDQLFTGSGRKLGIGREGNVAPWYRQ